MDEFPLIDSLPALIWVSGVDHAGTYFNRTWLAFTGRTLEEEQGDGWTECVHPDDHAVLEGCLSAFRSRIPFQIEFRLRRHDGEYRWMLDHGVPRFSAGGEFIGFIGSCLDITERKLAEERQSILNAELDHRVRNALASVRAMLRLSVESTGSKEEFAAGLEGRINAYAKAYGLLAAQGWDGAGMRSLISSILAPYTEGAGSRARVAGPDVVLQPQAALPFSLVIHELATNAAKHGALSVAGGTVAVRWHVAGARIDLVWEETGGPPVAQPHRRGFGSSLIEDLPRDLGGSGRLEFAAAGLRWHAELPAERILKHAAPHAVASGREDAASRKAEAEPGRLLEGARILVVEDDPLIGLELKDILCGAGADVVGPMTNVPAALTAAVQDLDGAVLDVNLRGEVVVPVASLLARRQVPFLLMTGYASHSLPPELRSTPTLQKPVSALAIIQRLSDFLRPPDVRLPQPGAMRAE